MNRILLAVLLHLPLALSWVAHAHASDSDGKWALYGWIETGQWHYSLIHKPEHNPDAAEIHDSDTRSIEAIKNRLSLLRPGSEVSLNPLPVLNLELHQPPSVTLDEINRVCHNAKILCVF